MRGPHGRRNPSRWPFGDPPDSPAVPDSGSQTPMRNRLFLIGESQTLMRNEPFLIRESALQMRNWPFQIRGSQTRMRNGVFLIGGRPSPVRNGLFQIRESQTPIRNGVFVIGGKPPQMPGGIRGVSILFGSSGDASPIFHFHGLPLLEPGGGIAHIVPGVGHSEQDFEAAR